MKSELKKKWVEALRSGEYAQTRNRLVRDYNQYCCLGVLCEVAGLKKVDGSFFVHPENEDHDEYYSLSIAALNKFGLDGDVADDLAARNDGTGGYDSQSFEEIATHIEKTVQED